MLDDGAAPTARPMVWLEPILEQMGQENDEVSLDGTLLASTHVLDLFEQIGDVEFVEAPLAQPRSLLLDPQVEVALVERLTLFGHLVRTRHGAAFSHRQFATLAQDHEAARASECRSGVAGSCLSLAQDLLDPGDRLVDRLLGADALGGDAMDRLGPDPLLKDQAVAPVA